MKLFCPSSPTAQDIRSNYLRLLALVLVCLGLAVALPRFTSATRQDSGEPSFNNKTRKPDAVSGQILVRFRKGAAFARTAQMQTLAVGDGHVISLRLEDLAASEIIDGLRLAHVDPSETAAAIEILRSRPDVIYAEPNFIRRKTVAPADPRYTDLWGLKNTGQSFGTLGADIKAESAWDVTIGSRDIVVAVIDEGIDVNHQDLQSNIWRNSGETAGNGVDDDANGLVDDVNGYDFFHNDASVYDGPGTNPDGSAIDAHGTHVAGTIGATGNNGIGVVGVNWQVSLMSLKFLGPEGGETADLLEALAYAKMMRDRWVSSGGTQGANIRVTNNSYGGGEYSQAEADAIAAIATSGILFVASAGNESQDNNTLPSYPASYDLPNIISVAATDRQDRFASFSNKGSRSVHLGAPGVSILSTTPGNTYSFFNGTSMASPHVAGAAALVFAAHSDFSVRRARAALLFGGEPIQALAQTTLTGNRLDAAGALQNALDADTTSPAAIGDLHITGQFGRSVSLAWTATGDDGGNGRASLYEIRFVDQATGAKFSIGGQRPSVAGTQEFAEVYVPYRHAAGTITVVTSDNAGNNATASVPVTVNVNAAEPYTVTEGPAEALSTGGVPLNANYDDFLVNYGTSFNFPFFERYGSSIYVSTNGAIYFLPSSPGVYDVLSSSGQLPAFQMVAGLWDDLDLRKSSRSDADIYVVQPDSNRIIFRWQGVPCNASAAGSCQGGAPVNFEIELRRDGTIITRYGDGNTQLHPVVGIGAGEPDAYLISSHTSEFAPKDLTNASTVTYTLKAQPAKADLEVKTQAFPTTVVTGENITYISTVKNLGPNTASGVTFSDTLAISTQFVSCATTQGTCLAGGGSSRLATAALGPIASGSSVTVTIVAKALAYQNTYDNVASATSRAYDSNQSNNFGNSTIQGYLANPNPLNRVTAISTGGGHSLAIGADGYVLAWGMNTFGQLGDGTNDSRTTPVYVKNLDGIKAIAAGQGFSVAVKPNGTVWTWGINSEAQLGDGTLVGRTAPVNLPQLSGITSVASVFHTMALKTDGTVWTFGMNTNGQLGDNTTNQRLTPAVVNGLSNVVAVAAGYGHSVALRNDGTVYTWGDNSQGQLGDGTTAPHYTPVQVPSLSGVTKIASWGYFTVALKNDGTVWTWGSNNLGQLGDGTTTMRKTPVQVSGLSSVSAISAGVAHVLALRSDGRIWAWGSNYSNQLGAGRDLSPSYYSPVPLPVIILSGATSIAAGNEGSLGLSANGTVFGWGAAGTRGFPYEMNAPATRPPLDPVVFNPDGGSFSGPQAVTITLPSAAVQVTPVSVSLGGEHSLAVMSDGRVFAWGSNDRGQIGLPVSSGNNLSAIPLAVNGIDSVTKVAAGSNFSLALKSNGTVWAWGSNDQGQGGPGGGANANVPRLVTGINGAVAIAAGTQHSLAVRSDGTVWAWGDNQYGQLGDGSTTSRATPGQVAGLTSIIAVAGGSYHSLALRNDGTLWVWGDNRHGEMGDGTISISRPLPAQVPGFTNGTAVTCGIFRNGALRSDGTVWGWGLNQYGELGDGTTDSKRTPTMAIGITGVVSLQTRNYTTVVLRNDGTVWSWGSNDYAQLGTGYPPFSRVLPSQIPGLANISAVALGGAHVIAIAPNSNLWVWGKNSFGQLGDGATIQRNAPVNQNFFNQGPAIHYSTNGVDPTTNDPVVASGGTVMLSRNTMLKARVFREGFAPSTIKSAPFQIDSNQINDTAFFVTQHYRDFLNREPDAPGLQFWTSNIDSCGADAECRERKRIDTSAAYFLSIEFQQTGYLVHRFYRASFGRRPLFAEFLADTQSIGNGVVVNAPGWELVLENNIRSFADAWTARVAFKSAYDAMSNTQFVDALIANTGVSFTPTDRQAFIDVLESKSQSRAQVVRHIAENQTFYNAEYNPAFVEMQYFGYLRRNPQDAPDNNLDGFNFWLNKLNGFGGDFRRAEMVKAFLVSGEYRQRFATP